MLGICYIYIRAQSPCGYRHAISQLFSTTMPTKTVAKTANQGSNSARSGIRAENSQPAFSEHFYSRHRLYFYCHALERGV